MVIGSCKKDKLGRQLHHNWKHLPFEKWPKDARFASQCSRCGIRVKSVVVPYDEAETLGPPGDTPVKGQEF